MADGITIDAELRPGRTWRGRRADGLPIVAKALPADCLRDSKLHPAIAQRLLRLREMPLTTTANLLGVERTDVGVMLVSEFVPGTPLADLPAVEQSRFADATRAIIADVHRFGLVHGAVHAGNLIVTPDRELRLIDPSPLLYEDAETDLVDLAALFRSDDEHTEDAAGRWQWRPLAAAAAVAIIAGSAAGAWVFHTAGR